MKPNSSLKSAAFVAAALITATAGMSTNAYSENSTGKPGRYDMKAAADERIDLSVTNATIPEILHAIDGAAQVPSGIMVAVVPRAAQKQRFSIQVKNIRVEDALRATAGFAHCGFYTLPEGFVIAPYFVLTPRQRARIIKSDIDSTQPPAAQPKTGSQR